MRSSEPWRRLQIALWALLLVGCQSASPTLSASHATAGTAATSGETAGAVLERPSLAPAASAPAATAPASAEPVSFSGPRAWQHVDHLANQIGPRVAGSPAQFVAADYLEQQFTAFGLRTEWQTFSFRAFDDRGSSLEMLGPGGSSLNALTLTYSAGGEVEAEVVHVGLARQGDFPPARVSGKIGLAERGEIRFSEKVTNLAEAGAVGVIIYNNQPGIFAGSLTGQGEVPVVAISAEDGERLLGLVQRGRTVVRLKVEAELQERTGLNLVAVSEAGPKTVVIGAHYDSVSAGPGANDNASGTAVLLELARAIPGRQYPFSIRLVAFGAEEIGLLGSRYYVAQLDEAARRSILAMVNLDMVGVGDQVELAGDSAVVDRALRLTRETGHQAKQLANGPGSSSDHASFQAAGIAALFVHRANDPRYHTAEDKAEHVLPEHLATAGQLALALLDELARQP